MDQQARRFVAVIVAALVLMAGYLILLENQMNKLGWGDEGREDGDDPGWEELDDQIFVYGNVTWVDWDRVMDLPITVATGGALQLVDCSIGFDIEDLPRWRHVPAVSVEMGASLTLEDSELFIDADPRLDGAIISKEAHSWSDYNLWRVVNLEGAEEPYLGFDLEWRQGGTYVAIAAQAGPGEEPVLLDVLRSGKTHLGDWTHVEVSLAQFAGGQPRLFIFLGNTTDWDVLLANVTVMDKGGPLPGDLPFTGNPTKDGWGGEGFISFYEYVEDRGRLAPLIEGMGDLSFVRSTVRAVEGLARWSEGTHRMIQRAVDPNLGPSNLDGASIGAEVSIWGADLEVRDSEFLYVPITGRDCSIDLLGSTFRGDADLVTIGNVRGGVRDCIFNFTIPIVDRGGRGSIGTPWALSLEGQWDLAYMPVTGCEFSGGGGYGLHLNDVRLDLASCSFEGLNIAIWDHDSDLLEDWDGLNASNEFGPNCHAWYIETHAMTVLFLGRDRPGWRDPDWDSTYYGNDPKLPASMPIYTDEVNGVYCVPTHIAWPEEGLVTVGTLRERVDLSWARDRVFEFEAASTSIVVNLDEIATADPDPDYEVSTDVELSPGTAPEVVHFKITCEFWGSSYEFPTLYVEMDGVIVESFDMLDPEYTWDYRGVHVPYNLTMPPGTHEVIVSLLALHIYLNQTVEVYNWTATLLRADMNMTSPDMDAIMSSGTGVIMLDPGVTVDGVEYNGPTDEDFDYSYGPDRLYVMAGNDSVLSVDLLGSAYLYLQMYGPGKMIIHKRQGEWQSYWTFGGELILERTSGYLVLTSISTDVTIRNVQDSLILELVSSSGSNITVEDCDMTGTGYFYINPSFSNVTVRNCTMVADSYQYIGLYIVPDHNTSLDVRDCHFTEALFTITPEPYINWSLNVTDCTFEGRDCYLTLTGKVNRYYYDEFRDEYYPVPLPWGDGIWGNTFSGDGAGIIIADSVRRDVLGDNVMGDGVSVFSHLGPQTTYDGDFFYRSRSYRIIDCEGCIGQWPYRDYTHDRMNVAIVNMTSDILGPIDPAYVDIVIHSMEDSIWSPGTVIGFDTLRYDVDEVVIKVPDWTNLILLIKALKEDVIIVDNWWTD